MVTLRSLLLPVWQSITLFGCQSFGRNHFYTSRKNSVTEAIIHLETMPVFVGVTTAPAAVPGPDNTFVLTQSAVHGRIAWLIITLGMVLGFFVHTTAVGVAVIFKTSQYAFSALKYAGAAYLLYLAWQALTASLGNFEGDKSKSKTVSVWIYIVYCQPKTKIFFGIFASVCRFRKWISYSSVQSTWSINVLCDTSSFWCSSDCCRCAWHMDQRFYKDSDLA